MGFLGQQSQRGSVFCSAAEGSPRRRKAIAVTVGFSLVVAGSAFALALGLQDPGFENGFGSWLAKVDRPVGNGIPGDNSGKPNRQVVYGPGGSASAVVPCVPGDRYGICIVTGTDSWVTDGTGEAKSVTPRYGNKMLRINGPFTNPYQRQQQNHRMSVEQAFTVDAARRSSGPATSSTPMIRLRAIPRQGPAPVQVSTPRGGDPLAGPRNPVPPRGAGTSLRRTRWLRDRIRLGAFAGRDVTIRIAYTVAKTAKAVPGSISTPPKPSPSRGSPSHSPAPGADGHRARHQLPGRLHRALPGRAGGRARRRCGGRLDVHRILGGVHRHDVQPDDGLGQGRNGDVHRGRRGRLRTRPPRR